MIPYLKLIRLPNAVTSVADIVAGFLIAGLVFGGPAWWYLALLMGASACLYLAGMAFNDIADRAEDALTRPGRPIPSGEVSLRGAVWCGVALIFVGCGLAAAVGLASLVVALGLTAAVLLYDFSAKGILFGGPAVLGLCRFLNVLLGMSAAHHFEQNVFDPSLWHTLHAPALTVGLYAAGLTAFSAQEEVGKRMTAIVLGWIFVGGAFALGGLTAPHLWVWLPLGLLSAVLLFRTVVLAREGTPLAAKNLVVNGVMGVCLVDAGLLLGHVGPESWPYATGVVALLIPGKLLAGWLAQKEA